MGFLRIDKGFGFIIHDLPPLDLSRSFFIDLGSTEDAAGLGLSPIRKCEPITCLMIHLQIHATERTPPSFLCLGEKGKKGDYESKD
jgi:hypothetical protein